MNGIRWEWQKAIKIRRRSWWVKVKKYIKEATNEQTNWVIKWIRFTSVSTTTNLINKTIDHTLAMLVFSFVVFLSFIHKNVVFFSPLFAPMWADLANFKLKITIPFIHSIVNSFGNDHTIDFSKRHQLNSFTCHSYFWCWKTQFILVDNHTNLKANHQRNGKRMKKERKSQKFLDFPIESFLWCSKTHKIERLWEWTKFQWHFSLKYQT